MSAFVGEKKRILVAMSGGVDSSVAAALLKEQGHEVIGVTMQLWDYSKNENGCNPDEKFDTCCSLDDVADARSVAHRLGIPFYVMDYQQEFQSNVVDYFTSEYLKGRTPNPCVACNTFLKFDLLMERALRLGCSHVATGHYARIEFENGHWSLKKGLDPQKDQSYFLYSFTQERMAHTLFPLGGLTKPEVRALAEKYGLLNAQKKESMEICFIPNNDYAKFIEKHTSPSDIIKGEVFHENGTRLCSHDGIHKFTVGQRKGLGLAAGQPLYVTRIESETGNVYVGEEHWLLKSGFAFRDFHLTRPLKPSEALEVKIRYRSVPTAGRVMGFPEGAPLDLGLTLAQECGENGDVPTGRPFSFQFATPQKSVTPGQIAVLHVGDEVVGGGFIDKVYG